MLFNWKPFIISMYIVQYSTVLSTGHVLNTVLSSLLSLVQYSFQYSVVLSTVQYSVHVQYCPQYSIFLSRLYWGHYCTEDSRPTEDSTVLKIVQLSVQCCPQYNTVLVQYYLQYSTALSTIIQSILTLKKTWRCHQNYTDEHISLVTFTVSHRMSQ